MLYYRITGINQESEQEEYKGGNSEKMIAKISQSAERFTERKLCKGYFFFTEVGESVRIGVITPEPLDMREVERFLNATHVCAGELQAKEVLYGELRQMLRVADRRGYIADDDEVLHRFHLDALTDNFFHFGEHIFSHRDRKAITADAGEIMMGETFYPELERIYAPAKKTAFSGHPVHYIIETDDTALRKKMYRLLLQALYDNGRIKSRRYSFINIEASDEIDKERMEAFYESSIGGTVVVRCSEAVSADDSCASADEQNIEDMCSIIKRYRNRVLTVLCLARACVREKESFYSALGSIAMVEIREEFAEGEKAKDYLAMLAKESKVRADKKLFACVEEGQKYLSPSLQAMFDEWYNGKLKSKAFPQYAEIKGAKSGALKAKPKGSAYDELQEMIGLNEAKQVIGKALSFYKVQKLYKDKGIRQDHLAMHMVFTGNPGTAKTTVARLFAKIMRDNDLLAKGHMVEVGRSDLVGKYVGWTAKIVKEKFQEAKGGVLFIDEAYSLVEEKGSYGDEAINTIVQEMENHREDVVVIFAGYPDKMEQFLQRNPGLRSRIAFHVPFADYCTEEIGAIAELICRSKGLKLTDDAKKKLEGIFSRARTRADFGNGRYVRNILERARMSQAERILTLDFSEVTGEVIATLTAEDITEMKLGGSEETKQAIGFSVGAA